MVAGHTSVSHKGWWWWSTCTRGVGRHQVEVRTNPFSSPLYHLNGWYTHFNMSGYLVGRQNPRFNWGEEVCSKNHLEGIYITIRWTHLEVIKSLGCRRLGFRTSAARHPPSQRFFEQNSFAFPPERRHKWLDPSSSGQNGFSPFYSARLINRLPSPPPFQSFNYFGCEDETKKRRKWSIEMDHCLTIANTKRNNKNKPAGMKQALRNWRRRVMTARQPPSLVREQNMEGTVFQESNGKWTLCHSNLPPPLYGIIFSLPSAGWKTHFLTTHQAEPFFPGEREREREKKVLECLYHPTLDMVEMRGVVISPILRHLPCMGF